ncbi:hypothetical protein AMS68_000838 [Peltaster fructicola]|uniref:Myb-like domain-containing protein n=1 Tax=Peltaster fructicola TaxID=286661 RepID=A0A6H0XL12_9PEZI|nr:hypothetical protein AMS68_000838 [Peltaster fructicola]
MEEEDDHEDCLSDSETDSIGDEFISDRRANDQRLKSRFEQIFRKYERDFTGIGDEINLATGEIVINNGHIESMQHEVDPGQVAASTFIDSLAHDYAADTTAEATPEIQDDYDDDDDSSFHAALHSLGHDIDQLGSTTPDNIDTDHEGNSRHQTQHYRDTNRQVQPRIDPALLRRSTVTPTVVTEGEESDSGEHTILPPHIKVLQSMPGVFKDSLLAMESESGPFDKASLEQLQQNIAAQVAQFLATSNPTLYDSQTSAGVREAAWTYPELPPRKRQRIGSPTAARPSLVSSAALFTESPRGRGSLWALDENDNQWAEDGGDSGGEDYNMHDQSDVFTDAQARFMSVVQDHATPAPAPNGYRPFMVHSDLLLTSNTLYPANTARRLEPKKPGEKYHENLPVMPKEWKIIQYLPKQIIKQMAQPLSPRAGAMMQWQRARHMRADVTPAIAPKVLPPPKNPVQTQPTQATTFIHTPFSDCAAVFALQKKYVRKLANLREEDDGYNLKRMPYSAEEDKLLVEMKHLKKMEWPAIAERMPGRPVESCVNRYNYIRRLILPDVLEPPGQGNDMSPQRKAAILAKITQPPKFVQRKGEYLRSLFVGTSPEVTAEIGHQDNDSSAGAAEHEGDAPIGAGTESNDVEPREPSPEVPTLMYDFTEEQDRAIKLMRESRKMMFDDIAQHFSGATEEIVGNRYYTHVYGRKFPAPSDEMKLAVEKIAARASIIRYAQPPKPRKKAFRRVYAHLLPQNSKKRAEVTADDTGRRPPVEESHSRTEVPNSTASQHEWSGSQDRVHGPNVWLPGRLSEGGSSSKHDSVLEDGQTENIDDSGLTIFDQQHTDSPAALPQRTSTPPSSPPLLTTYPGATDSKNQQHMQASSEAYTGGYNITGRTTSAVNSALDPRLAQWAQPIQARSTIHNVQSVRAIQPASNMQNARQAPHMGQGSMFGGPQPVERNLAPPPFPIPNPQQFPPGQGSMSWYPQAALTPTQPQYSHSSIPWPAPSGQPPIYLTLPPAQPPDRRNGIPWSAHNGQNFIRPTQPPKGRNEIPWSAHNGQNFIRPAQPPNGRNEVPQSAHNGQRVRPTLQPQAGLHSRPLNQAIFPRPTWGGVLQQQPPAVRQFVNTVLQTKDKAVPRHLHSQPRKKTQKQSDPLRAHSKNASAKHRDSSKPGRKRKSVIHSASEDDSGSEFDPDSSDDEQETDSQGSLSPFRHEGDDDDGSSKLADEPATTNYKVDVEPAARDRFLEMARQMVAPRPDRALQSRKSLICYRSDDDDYSDWEKEAEVEEESADEIEADLLLKSGCRPAVAERKMVRQAGGELKALARARPSVPATVVSSGELVPLQAGESTHQNNGARESTSVDPSLRDDDQTASARGDSSSRGDDNNRASTIVIEQSPPSDDNKASTTVVDLRREPSPASDKYVSMQLPEPSSAPKTQICQPRQEVEVEPTSQPAASVPKAKVNDQEPLPSSVMSVELRPGDEVDELAQESDLPSMATPANDKQRPSGVAMSVDLAQHDDDDDELAQEPTLSTTTRLANKQKRPSNSTTSLAVAQQKQVDMLAQEPDVSTIAKTASPAVQPTIQQKASVPSSSRATPKIKLTMTKARIDGRRASLVQRDPVADRQNHITKAKKRQSAPSRLNEVHRTAHDLSDDELA